MLILAGVVLATLTGQGNIIGNAENAVGKYQEEVNKEELVLNSIEKFFIEKTDRNEPIVRAKQESLTIILGEKYEVSDYFEIDVNGASNIKDIVYSIQDTSTLPVGEHILTCTVTKESGKSSSASMTIIVKLEYTEQNWTTAGTYTFTVPAGVTRIKVAACGGGAGGLTIADYDSRSGANGLSGTAGNGGDSQFGDFIVQGGKGATGKARLWYYMDLTQGEVANPNGKIGATKTGVNWDAPGHTCWVAANPIRGATGFDMSFSMTDGNYGAGGNSGHYYDSDGSAAQIGAGGNSGAYDTGYVDVTPGQEIQVIVGVGGTGVKNENDGEYGRYDVTNGTSGFVLIAYGGDI